MPCSFVVMPPVPYSVMLAGQEDQLQIDGINRLIKAMQEISSPTPTAAAPPTKPRVAQTGMQTVPTTDSSGRPIAYTGNTSAVARSGNMQTAAMRSNTPVSTSYRSNTPVTTAATRGVQSSSASSLDRSQAVQGSSPAETMQQTVQMLQWFVQEASRLPPAARLEALRWASATAPPPHPHPRPSLPPAPLYGIRRSSHSTALVFHCTSAC